MERRMTSSEFEIEAVRPLSASCDDTHIVVDLADGRHISAPLYWYPFLENAAAKDRSQIELEYSGIWWPTLDEGISVKALLMAWRAPKAIGKGNRHFEH